MNILFQAFEKARMIRKGSQLVAPPVSGLLAYQLPINSLLHYVSNTKIEAGPPSDHLLLRSTTKPVQLYTPIKLIDPPNNPRPITFDSRPLLAGYLIRNRRFRKLIELDRMPKDDKTLVVANYALMHHSYKYVRSLFADYNEWTDAMYTVMSTANEIAKISQRNQFIVIDVPQVLPAISRLNVAARTMDQNSLKIFNNDASRMLLELWKWLSADPIPNIFDRIEPKYYKYINFIVQDSNRWTCVSMDRLHWWKQTTIDQYRADVTAKKVDPKEIKPYEALKFENVQLQKYLLRMFMTLASARSDTSIDANVQMQDAMNEKPVPDEEKPSKGEITGEEDDDNPNGMGDEDAVVVKKPNDLEDSIDSSSSLSKNGVKSSEQILLEVAQLSSKEDDDSSKVQITAEVNAMIDEDLAQLETMNAREESIEVVNPNTGEVLPLAVDDTRSYEQRIKDRCGVMAEAGLLTAAEYRRLTTLSEKYKSLPNPIPGGKGTLLEAMVITPEEQAISTTHVVAPGATVIDQTMLHSSIEIAQQKYIKHTLHKHILKAIVHLQNADMIIDNIEIERNESVLGARHDYLVRVIPLEGAPTTLRFPIPVIDEDGTYTSNNTKYAKRIVRRDISIRKIASNKVTMTSYYGKYSMVRARKATNDYGQWIVNEVMSIGFTPENDRISDVRTANVFLIDFKSPRSISSLSKQIREFTVTTDDGEKFVFNLDFTKTYDTFNKDIVQPWIDKGFMPVAKSNKNHLIYFEGDSFYLIHGETIKPLGDLETILQLDVESAPVEYAELKIAGKFIPVGMILAYDYGLTELIRRLKVQTRRVPVGTRVNLQPDEASITFSDETLVFNKSDKLAMLLLGGFHEFKRVIRGFSITDFDNKGVYQNVFDSTGGGTRVLREIDLARKMFVDPMSKDVLVKKKMPTEFMGLLVHGAELLIDDMHREEFDAAEQRFVGYETVAGAIYTELVKSIKIHNARPGKSRYPLELKPFAIWQNLAQDQSVVTVKDINPIANLRTREEVTYTGNGGRSKDTMNAESRAFGKNDVGVISEASKDSGDVGINTYLASNPLLTDTMGIPLAPDKKGDIPLTSIFSSALLVAPGSEHDD